MIDRAARRTPLRRAMLIAPDVSFLGHSLRYLFGLGTAAAAIAAIWTQAPDEPWLRAGLTAGVAGVTVLAIVSRAARRRSRRGRALAGPLGAAGQSDGADHDAVLVALGIETGGGELKAACTRVARQIHQDGIRVIGFVPASDSVAVPPVLIQLGLALTELTGATIAVVDANVRYPGLGTVNRDQAPDSDESVFSTRWLQGSLALLSPPGVERAGQVVPQLARVLIDGADLFAHVLVDLTGFDLLGEHASAAACMDAVAIVGRTHQTRENELLELARLMPRGRFLGVLLVG